MASALSRNKRYTGDGGIDGEVIIGKHRYLIGPNAIAAILLYNTFRFDTLLKRHNCRGLFCLTGKTGAASKKAVASPVIGWRLSAASA